MTRDRFPIRFPGAPDNAYLTEEGWLVVGDEAWTEHEWQLRGPEDSEKYARRYQSDEERLEAKRASRRRYKLQHPRNTFGYSACPHCGFESVTQKATKQHVRRMHDEAA